MRQTIILSGAALALSACAAPPAPGYVDGCTASGGDPARAARFCMRALDSDGLAPAQRADLAQSLGKRLEQMESFGQAESAYAQALAADPTRAAAHAGRARSLEAMGRPYDADAAWREAAAAAPADMELRAQRGRFLLRRGDARGALAEFDAAARGGRRDPAQAAKDRASALAALGRAGDAETLYTLALARRPDDVEALMGRGALRAARDPAAGLRDFAHAAALSPLDPAPVYAEGRVLEALGRAAEADDRYRRAWELGARDEFLAARLSG